MRPVPLTALKGGINRLRIKGAASSQQLYDLVNGRITADGSVVVREGTIRSATLSSGTVGLTVLDGKFNVFSRDLVAVPSGFVCNRLINPNDATQQPTKIWFAKPFMGFLYVVAQFGNGDIVHYWLQSNGTWAANKVYTTGSIVTPTVSNGLAYLAQRNFPTYPTWSSETATVLNTIIEPTEYTGYAYKAVSVEGAAPHTGATEPSWPTTKGGLLQEFGDFDTSSTDSGTTQTDSGTTASTPLGSNITDRYGNSATISGSGSSKSSGQTGPVLAQQKVTTWKPGTNYAPGAVTQPSKNQGAFIGAIPNGDFEAGDDGSWVLDAQWSFSGAGEYQGTECVTIGTGNLSGSGNYVTMATFGLVHPGQSVTASAYLNPNNSGADLELWLCLKWYDASDTFLSEVRAPSQTSGAEGGGYRKVTITSSAPPGAAHARVAIRAGSGTTSRNPGFADLVEWNLETPAAVSNFLFEAVQNAAASSGSTEPTWPTVAGNTVVDGGVTWKAIGTSIITWQAIPLMLSGASQPTFPTTIGNTVSDPSTFTDQNGVVIKTSMSWQAIDRHVDTPNPSTAVTLAASHVFNGDSDIVDYSAAVDPTDWTSTNNAGYLPTGLNNYGDNPVKMLALYRSNLMAFNAGGYQMWQVDPDPANMALLDAQPVGSIWPRAAQSVANDLLFLTEVGVRNLGTVGATANMQIGQTGQPIDSLVVAQMRAGTYDPLSLYYPGQGQYWLIFGPQAFVLTINGASGVRSWSRYVFPASITDWTLNGETLYMRTSTNVVWQLDAGTLIDDSGGANVVFDGVIQWPYLDLGVLGINKMLVGIDLVGDGDVTIQIGFDQRDPTTFSDNAGFSTSLNVTPPYEIAVADTIPEEPIPFVINAPSYTLILTFGGNQKWSLEAANFYLTNASGAGATG